MSAALGVVVSTALWALLAVGSLWRRGTSLPTYPVSPFNLELKGKLRVHGTAALFYVRC